MREDSWISDGEGRRLALRLPCPQAVSVMEACEVAEREIVRGGKTFILRKVVRKVVRRGSTGWWALYGPAPRLRNGRCRKAEEEE